MHTGAARIGVINRAVNWRSSLPAISCSGVLGRRSAPLETFTTGRDCEDYAIAKYVALIEAGVSRDDVKLLIVRSFAANDDYAVAVRLSVSTAAKIVLANRWLLAGAGR